MAAPRSRLVSSAIAKQLRHPPVFLAPALAEPSITIGSSLRTFGAGHAIVASQFSTSGRQAKRDGNRNRGVSALRRKYPKQPLAMAKEPLPKPVLDPARRTKVVADPDHGLWAFFPPARQALMTPEEMAAHGRAWTVQELRAKSWEDLHALWWVCAKEKNMISTQEAERVRLKAGYGSFEAQDRINAVKQTQRAIKHALTERWYAYQNALKVVKDDPSVIEDGIGVWEDIKDEDISGGDSVGSASKALPEASGPAVVAEGEMKRGAQPA